MAVGDLGRFLVLLAVGLFGLALLGSSFAGAEAKTRRTLSVVTAALMLGYAGLLQIRLGSVFHFGIAFTVLGAVSFVGLAWSALKLGSTLDDRLKSKITSWAFT